MTAENTELLIMISIGIALLIIGIYQRSRYSKLTRLGILTEGTIIGFESSPDEDGITYFPKVSYITLSNERIIKNHNVGYNTKLYKIGDSVPVFYDVADNNRFIIDDKRTRITGPGFLIVGVCLIFFVIIQYFFHLFPIQ